MLQWVAVYDGNDTLPQYNEDGTENKYSDIDRDRLERFVLVDNSNDQVKFVLNMGAGKKLIYRRRTAISLKSKITEVAYIIGYQETLDGGASSIQSICFIFESTGHIEMTDGFREGHRWFYPVVFLPEEEL